MVPVWAAVALIVSQPLHFVFAVVVPNGLLDVTLGLPCRGPVATRAHLRDALRRWLSQPSTSWESDVDDGALAGRTAHLERTAEGLDPVRAGSVIVLTKVPDG